MSYPAEPYARWCRRWLDASALFGAVVWLVARPELGFVEAAVSLATLVLVPLLLHLTLTTGVDGTLPRVYLGAVTLQPVAAALVPFSFTLPEGPLAGLLVLPWLGVVGFLTAFGLWRLLPRGTAPRSELAVDAGLLYVPVGGVALVLHRFGLGFLQFGALLVLLAAAHFHYAGLTLPVVSGLGARVLPDSGRVGRVVDAALWAIVLGPVFILVGITFSPLVEVVSVGFFTVAVGAFAVCLLRWGLPELDSRPQQALLAASSLSVVASMALALTFGLSAFLGAGVIDIPRMVALHGRLNVFGFALPGVVGWRLAVPEGPDERPRVTFSRLASDSHVGTAFFDRPAVRGSADPAPTGMVDHLEQLGGFNPAVADQAVRAVYERSGDAEMRVAPDWPRGLGWLAANVYRPLAERAGQLVLPVSGVADGLSGRVVAVDADADGRDDVRAWTRSYDDGTTMYAAAYAVQGGLLTVAFPLPFANLSAVLRVEPGAAPGGLHQTSHGSGPEGLYLVVAGVPMRLPLDETFEFRPAAADSGGEDGPFPDCSGVRARHEVTLSPPFDAVPLFALEYAIEFPAGP